MLTAVAVACVFVVLVLLFGLTRVKSGEVAVIEWVGVHRGKILQPGISWTWPILEQARSFRWTHCDLVQGKIEERVIGGNRVPTNILRIDPPPQTVATHDQIAIEVDVVVQFRIVRANEAIYNTQDLLTSMEIILHATMTQTIGKHNMIWLLENQHALRNDLYQAYRERGTHWGIEVVSIDIQHFKLPAELQQLRIQESKAVQEYSMKQTAQQKEKELQNIRNSMMLDEAQARAGALKIATEAEAQSYVTRKKSEVAGDLLYFQGIAQDPAILDLYVKRQQLEALRNAQVIAAPLESLGYLSTSLLHVSPPLTKRIPGNTQNRE